MIDYTPEKITYNDMIICVEREIKMRERVYPRWIAAGKMTQKKADFELDTMRHVLFFLQENAPKENDKQGSFDL